MEILIVDDDAVDRESVKRSLLSSSFDCDISEAFDVDTASAMCAEKKFDIILLDYQLPKRDGIELLLELRKKDTVDLEIVVMMSNSEDEKLALSCIQAGAQDFLLKKEITAAKLRRTILQAQKRFELEKELQDSFQRVKRLAERDSLTDLANRYLFDETFKVSVANHKRSHLMLALILFDVDNFKLINDSYGHSIGDQLLQEICKAISTTLRGDELFARIGGDEFTIMLSNLHSPHEAAQVAKRIHRSINKPFMINGHEITTSISIGISVHDKYHAKSAEELLKYADIAMYRSKRKGRGLISFFEEGMQEQTQRRLMLESGLSQALNKHEFVLHYQPVFDLEATALLGFEALIRWQSEGGLVSPDEFIPVAEQAHYINDIGRWVIAEAVHQLSTWNNNRAVPLTMAINISPMQLSDKELPNIIESLCKEYDVAPSLLEFELTETALMNNDNTKTQALSNILALNCSLALDDFGTGYSSISHLQNTPLKTVKIDRSLMPLEGSDDKKQTALLTGLVQMIKALDLSVVAEGIETAAHESLCRTLGVDRVQGYYYSPGLSSNEIAERYL
jgi:diguanylate cyclase (GGDEF)-like protein